MRTRAPYIRRARPRLTAICPALLALIAAAVVRPAPAAGQQLVDRGTFTLYLRGAPIGEERFIIREERVGSSDTRYLAGGELNLKVDGRTTRMSVGLEALGPLARPRRYEAEINGQEATKIVGTLRRDRMRLEMRSPTGDEMKELLVRGKAAILERYVAHLYYFAWRQLGGERSAQVQVIAPQERVQQLATINDLGSEVVRINQRDLQLRHISIVAETGKTHHVWLDGNRVMKIELPADAFVAIRSDTGDSSQS